MGLYGRLYFLFFIIRWIFKGDGVLDRKEMKIILKQIYEMLGEECYSAKKKVDLIFEKFDSVKNELTLNEFLHGCLKDEYISQLFENSENMKYLSNQNVITNINTNTNANIPSNTRASKIKFIFS